MDVTLEFMAGLSIFCCISMPKMMHVVAKEVLPNMVEGDWRRRQWK
jgi:hypothetical protein